MIVTDHHQPGEQLPDCPIIHPEVERLSLRGSVRDRGGHKLAQAIARCRRPTRDLDLVALATVADLVPLQGENRALVRRGTARRRGELRGPGCAR